MKSPPFDYLRAATLDEAVSLLASHRDEAKLIAGGQSLLPMLAFRLLAPSLLIDIGRIAALRGIEISERGVRIGAGVRWCEIERDLDLARAHPLIVAAIRHVAHYQIRNRGTVGGGLAHADPAAEMPGLAVVCDANIAVRGPKGSRLIAARDFFVGAMTTALQADELITEIRFPSWRSGRRWGFEEFSRRRGDFAIAGVALFYDTDEASGVCDPHVGIIGACERPHRLAPVEAHLAGQRITPEVAVKAGEIAARSIEPNDDIHASADYRRALVAVLTERALLQSCTPAGAA